MTKYKIIFEPSGCEGVFPENSTIMECARQLNAGLINVCGGMGTCGKCLVIILEGNISPVLDKERKHISPEKLSQGYRLACCARISGDCRIRIPAESLSSLSRTQTEGQEIQVTLETNIRTCAVTLPHPASTDSTLDEECLQSLLKKCDIKAAVSDSKVLAEISAKTRDDDRTFQIIVRDNEIIGILPQEVHPPGLAVDLGTTKIAAYLLDLSTGKTVAKNSMLNPQTAFGDDVISRLTAAVHSDDDAVKLQELAVSAINSLVRKMCDETGREVEHITDVVVAGNTAMHHLLLKLPVKQLCNAPYIPAVKAALDIRAHGIGLKCSAGAYVHLLPNIAGYVGGDHLAMILASEMHKKDGVVLGLDIGTNTEISLAHDRKLTSVSCASGPAFEGAHIKHGMRAAGGAIEHIRLSGRESKYETIGNTPPIGICGSGIIDAVAQLLISGVIDNKGKMQSGPNVRETDGILEFVIAHGSDNRPDITFTQKDVREVQLAKGAISAGIQVLLETNGLKEEDIDEVIIAGAFGTYIDIKSAITIGMLPDLAPERFRQIGNAAGMGAGMALVSMSKRLEAQEIAEQIEYIELASYPAFNKIFTKALVMDL